MAFDPTAPAFLTPAVLELSAPFSALLSHKAADPSPRPPTSLTVAEVGGLPQFADWVRAHHERAAADSKLADGAGGSGDSTQHARVLHRLLHALSSRTPQSELSEADRALLSQPGGEGALYASMLATMARQPPPPTSAREGARRGPSRGQLGARPQLSSRARTTGVAADHESGAPATWQSMKMLNLQRKIAPAQAIS